MDGRMGAKDTGFGFLSVLFSPFCASFFFCNAYDENYKMAFLPASFSLSFFPLLLSEYTGLEKWVVEACYLLYWMGLVGVYFPFFLLFFSFSFHFILFLFFFFLLLFFYEVVSYTMGKGLYKVRRLGWWCGVLINTGEDN
ncbi:hypothetical protein V8C37DRAFT_93296 [Trichoderma ceciliae]